MQVNKIIIVTKIKYQKNPWKILSKTHFPRIFYFSLISISLTSERVLSGKTVRMTLWQAQPRLHFPAYE